MSLLEEMLARTGLSLDELRAEAAAHDSPGPRNEEVPDSAELKRIVALPRRPLDSEDIHTLLGPLSEAFRTPQGTMQLRPIQVLALRDLYELRGLFAPIRVGGGKTLISYLAPAIVGAKRPLLIIPAKLREKTRRDFRELSKHWEGPNPDSYRIESYEFLGRVGAGANLDGRPGFLERYAPDILILDEAHKAKNKKAAVTKRLKRFLEANPNVIVVAMSGTITKRSLRDYAHIIGWCLPNMCPLPKRPVDLDLWADAIDEKTNPLRRVKPGALVKLAKTDQERQEIYLGGEAGLTAVRKVFHARLVETPGCVATQEGPSDMSLSINAVMPPEEQELEDLFYKLRSDWLTPDDHPLADGIELWRHARELALGFFYRWNPRPPQEWIEARREWASLCRYILKNNRRGLDSEKQVANAIDAKLYDDQGILRRWRDIKPTFQLRTEAVWCSDSALKIAEEWAAKNAGIIWVEHVEFGLELSRRTGIPYYAAQGKDAQKKYILDHPPGTPLIASVLSSSEGQNLQAWSSNLVMSAPPNGAVWEQLLGRTHRDGQTEDEVSVDFFVGCWEHVAGFWQALRDAQYAQETTGQAQKLCYADRVVPTLEDLRATKTQRWVK